MKVPKKAMPAVAVYQKQMDKRKNRIRKKKVGLQKVKAMKNNNSAKGKKLSSPKGKKILKKIEIPIGGEGTSKVTKKKLIKKEKNGQATNNENSLSNGVNGTPKKKMQNGKNSIKEEVIDKTAKPLSAKDLDPRFVNDSKQLGQTTLRWVIHPKTEDEFFSDYWEQKPLYIKREDTYYGNLFSTEAFDKMLRHQNVQFTKNLDVTSYSNGQRETHNPPGRAHAPVVWDYYNNGCSLRLLNPQTFNKEVWRFLATLQEYFNSFSGANVYLTPPDSQGFAPHWDDIEAFVMQLEGQKRWRVYQPRTEEEVLPVNSSKNLEQEEIGEPILDVTLSPGDLLYMPRGFIHQGHTVEGFHSLHITMSTYQKNSWGQFFEKLLPQALKASMEEDVEFRKGLPREYLSCMGIANMDQNYPGRQEFIKKVGVLMARMLERAPLDAAVDQMGVGFMHDCLPPFLRPEETKCSVFGDGERWSSVDNKVIRRTEISPDTMVRLIRGNCLRVVAEEECVRIYYTLENSREYHGEEPQCIEIDPENAPAVEALIHAYPSYIAIEDLPVDEDAKVAVATGLWERGLLVTRDPLEAFSDDE